MPDGQAGLGLLIAGPCVLEDLETALAIGRTAKETADRHGLQYLFKASFDKANRSSGESPRGPGLDEGLRLLAQVKKELGVAVTTDIHETHQADRVAEVADCLQIPAFLCRQTDLLRAAAKTGRMVNVKKGQFMAPWDMRNVAEKLRAAGCEDLLLTERGTMFGYNSLVVDLRGLEIMRALGCRVVFDGTHSVQQPGGLGRATGGERRFVPALCRGAVAAGVDGIFLEIHPDPDRSPSDGPNMLPLDRLEPLIADLIAIDRALGRGHHPRGEWKEKKSQGGTVFIT